MNSPAPPTLPQIQRPTSCRLILTISGKHPKPMRLLGSRVSPGQYFDAYDHHIALVPFFGGVGGVLSLRSYVWQFNRCCISGCSPVSFQTILEKC
jgi:hypothetical protein